MKKLFFIILLSLLVVPVLVSAQPTDITEKCCRVGAQVIWKSGSVNDIPNCATAPSHCPIPKNTTIGPTATTPCSLRNSTGGVSATVQFHSDDWAMICAIGTIYTVTNWIFFIMMVLAVVLGVIGGFIYATAGGDPSKAGKGKTIIIFAIIGLAIALVARFIPPVVKFIMGVS